MVGWIRWLGLGMLATGCANDDDATSAAVGQVASSDAVVGLSWHDNAAVVAYVCGGETTLQDWTRWFQGTVDSDAVALTEGEWTLAGTWDGEAWQGTLEGPDGSSEWSAEPGQDDLVGLYEADDGGCTAGVVVSEQTGELSAQGAWCDPDAGVLRQVTPVNLGLEDGGLPVRVEGSTGPHDFTVTLVDP